ncbi:AraC family transcriptional regulator [Parapedobacter indicus]|uniref:AraC-type DNA-binding protein n=1 Tax=Parapedobacter indicus TaxID=1477437 RepID=A0A1I3RZ39_9SPHI|nr:AraC family transcriptional regulator [Parapedobacter indicus]PPK99917.1 AraC-like DNA-binding protein [Parapedobacter indicus]SFJ51904.1 AraC-type DNA-binding protein [Parapedobacter indicus]
MKPELIVDAPIVGQKKIWVKEINHSHFNHPFHFHKLCELVWIEKGHGKLIMGDYVGNYQAGDLVLISPEMPHLWRSDAVYYEKTLNLYTKATAIYFPSNLIARITDDTDSISRYQKMLVRAQRGIRFFGGIKSIILEKIAALRASTGLSRIGLFLQIVDLLSNTDHSEALASVSYRTSIDERDMKRFNDVYQYLLQNFARDISLKEMAEISHMSPNSFCRFFKLKTQKTFIQFLNEIRIGNACKLLQTDDYSLKEICYRCGYNNPTSFHTAFKQIMKVTPIEYRESLNQSAL